MSSETPQQPGSDPAQTQPQKPERLLRFRDVMQRIGRSRSGIYLMISRGEFPLPVKMGSRNVAFRESEIDDWIESRTRADIAVNQGAA